jgi:hypothetical protein
MNSKVVANFQELDHPNQYHWSIASEAFAFPTRLMVTPSQAGH